MLRIVHPSFTNILVPNTQIILFRLLFSACYIHSSTMRDEPISKETKQHKHHHFTNFKKSLSLNYHHQQEHSKKAYGDPVAVLNSQTNGITNSDFEDNSLTIEIGSDLETVRSTNTGTINTNERKSWFRSSFKKQRSVSNPVAISSSALFQSGPGDDHVDRTFNVFNKLRKWSGGSMSNRGKNPHAIILNIDDSINLSTDDSEISNKEQLQLHGPSVTIPPELYQSYLKSLVEFQEVNPFLNCNEKIVVDVFKALFISDNRKKTETNCQKVPPVGNSYEYFGIKKDSKEKIFNPLLQNSSRCCFSASSDSNPLLNDGSVNMYVEDVEDGYFSELLLISEIRG